MHSRFFVMPLMLALVLVAGAAPVAHGAEVVAQPGGDTEEDDADLTEEEQQQQPEDPEGAGEGQDDPAAESGAGEGESGEAATETGPPWTYQMARIALVLLLFLGLSTGLLYWRLVASRQRGIT